VIGADWKSLAGQLKKDVDGTRKGIHIDRSLTNDAGSAAAMQAEQKEVVGGKVRKLDGKEGAVDVRGWRNAEFDRGTG
jgi:hypothetical protein